MDLPIMSKPTFLNMSVNSENLVFSDFLINDNINSEFVQSIFGSNLDWDWINSIKIDFEAQNHWVWRPHSLKTSIASMVYDHLVSCNPNPWLGWDHIWKLCVLLRTKIFIWKLAHGKLPTSAYLYNLNVGPSTL